MRIASLDELEDGSGAGRRCSSEAENDRNEKADEHVRAPVGRITKEGDIVVASDSE